MEIEGLINHTLAAALVERDYIAKKFLDNKNHIAFWESIRKIQAHEELKARLQGIEHIRQILGSEEYMYYMIRQEPDEPLYFMGFPLKAIEFYLHLRTSNRVNNHEELDESL
jgi:hypothetical protein